jgi:hypothetical protein
MAQVQSTSANALPLMERMLERVVEQDAKSRTELELRLEKKEHENERLREAVKQAQIELLRDRAMAETKAAKAEAERQVELLRDRALATQIKLRDQQLVVLQTRLESMHASKLLTEEELQSLEDKIFDSYADDAAGRAASGDEVAQLIALSERISHDARLARQLQRRFIVLA